MPSRAAPDSIRLVFIGDIALGESPSSSGLGVSRARGSSLYRQWRDYLARFSGDFVLGNFEGTVSDRSDYAAEHVLYESMRVDPDCAGPLRDSGISHVSLANNHSNDHGQHALQGSRDYLRTQGIVAMEHFWRTGNVYEIRRFGLSIGVIALNFVDKSMGKTDDTISVSMKDVPALIVLITKQKQRYDHLIVTVHWGENYGLWPNESQLTLARQFVNVGASAVIGHHPHTIQDLVVIEDVPIVYSLGSFCFETKSPFTRLGQVVALDCSKSTVAIAAHRHISIGRDYRIGAKLSSLQRLVVSLVRRRPSPTLNFIFVRTVRLWIFIASLFRALRAGKFGRYVQWMRQRYAKALS